MSETASIDPKPAQAVSLSGTPAGIRAELHLTGPQIEAAISFMNKGLEVPLEGLHPFGAYAGDSVIVLPSQSRIVSDPVEEYTRGLYRIAWGDGWREVVRRKKVTNLPNHGDLLVEIGSAIAPIVGWNGTLYDGGTPHDMTGRAAQDVQGFLRRKLPEWRIKANQPGDLPIYDAGLVDVPFLEMLQAAVMVIQNDVTVFLIHAHLLSKGSEIPLRVAHAGCFDPEEGIEPSG